MTNEREIIENIRKECLKNPSNPTLCNILYMLHQLDEARKSTYRKIIGHIEQNICGDIFQIAIEDDNNAGIVAVGTDAIANIVFKEMGFTSEDQIEIG